MYDIDFPICGFSLKKRKKHFWYMWLVLTYICTIPAIKQLDVIVIKTNKPVDTEPVNKT